MAKGKIDLKKLKKVDMKPVQFLKASVAAILMVAIASCGPKKKEKRHEMAVDENVWPEMESFHAVMADAYHPFSSDKNLEPIKSLAQDLAVEAEKWAEAPLPARVNSEDVKTTLEKIKTDSRRLADMIKAGAKDEEIASALTALHDSFHEVMEKWNAARNDSDQEEEEDHEHDEQDDD